jgi:glyoxylase-like metal-dependent hydrolase (beta-lactamase superfamily II)
MIRNGIYAGVLAAAIATPVFAQGEAYEADALLRKAAAAMGASELNTVVYSAAGSGGGVGQPYTAGKAWPRLNVSFTRSVDYSAGSLSDDWVRSRAEQRGGTGVPLTGEQRVTEAVSGNLAWNVVNKNPVGGGRWVAERAPLVWLTPHGIIKAAQRNKSTLQFRTVGNRSLGAVSFEQSGRFRATALINDAGLVERIEAVVPNHVVGDMPVVINFSEYRDFGKFKFPTRIEETQGGLSSLQLVVTDVQPNGKVNIQVPDAAKTAKESVSSQRIGAGVWLIAGGSHNSVAVEAKDHVVVIEGPLYDDRALPVIEEVKKLIPGKPIRQVVNTHVHFDHSGGLGPFVAEGARVVTHASNKAYFERAFANKRSVSTDALGKSKKKAVVQAFGDKLVIGDAGQPVELYHLRGNPHTDGMLIAYLPKDKIVVQADVFAPLAAGAKPPAKPSPVTANFAENLQRHKLAVERIAGIHGGVAPAAELNRALGK